jgi:hypothetical protein
MGEGAGDDYREGRSLGSKCGFSCLGSPLARLGRGLSRLVGGAVVRDCGL